MNHTPQHKQNTERSLSRKELYKRNCNDAASRKLKIITTLLFDPFWNPWFKNRYVQQIISTIAIWLLTLSREYSCASVMTSSFRTSNDVILSRRFRIFCRIYCWRVCKKSKLTLKSLKYGWEIQFEGLDNILSSEYDDIVIIRENVAFNKYRVRKKSDRFAFKCEIIDSNITISVKYSHEKS